MINKIESLLKGYAQEAVADIKEIPTGQTDAVADAASGSIIDILKKKISSGDVSSLINSFKDDSAIQATTHEISGNLTQKLSGLGINVDSAKNIALSILPVILSKFSKGAGSSSGLEFQSLLGKLGDKVDLSTLGNMLSGDDDKSDKGSDKDGILGKLKGLF